jgi:glucan phosphoethanolaminetransferase (alkaline phosphatase superfamily)
MPRTETLILFAGLLCTGWSKFSVVRHHSQVNLFAETVSLIIPDILFFAIIILLFRCLYLLKPSAHTARCAIGIAVVIFSWSVLNAGWLISSRVQLQPGILLILTNDLKELWPLVRVYLLGRSTQIILLALISLSAAAGFFWRLYRPGKIIKQPTHHIRYGVGLIILITILSLTRLITVPSGHLGFTGEALGFSSHWHALASTAANFFKSSDTPLQTRNIPRTGQRNVVVPQSPPEQLPNVVLILMESVSHSVSSRENMPYLRSLADNGVDFSLTRIQVPQTSKALWSTLTSTTPVILPDYVEAIPANKPYESLASILSRAGYRSAFFEMAKGTFECAPGFCRNLGFDFAWFRENLEDPTAHLGYVSGDDCRMIKPMIDWTSQSDKPFFLTLMTSVSHDPYLLPAGFDEPASTKAEKYIQTIRYTDYFLKQFCKALKEQGLEKNTLICILGDHGTSFRVQEGFGRWVPYEEVIRIPWIIHWPGQIEAGQKIDWPCSQMDITPTILKLIGFDISQAGFEGKDAFSPLPLNRRLYFSSWYANSPRGFIEGDRKFIYWPYLDKVFEHDLNSDAQENIQMAVEGGLAKKIKADIVAWEEKTQITIDAKRYTEQLLYWHWQTFSAGRSAWAYYVP